MAEPLQVHVFGGKVGESIVLGLPKGRWGIIDVYLADPANPGRNPAIRFLESRRVKELEFLCLTHPHSDHVKGVKYFVENYRIRRFLGFGALPPEQLYNQIVKVLKTKAKRLHDRTEEEAIATELLDALEVVNEKVKRREMVHDPVVVNSCVFYEDVEPEKLRLRIMAIAPSGRSVGVYNGQLSACFDKGNPGKILADKVEGVDHNEISSAFMVEYGAHRVLLGGDVESPGWLDILGRPGPGFVLRADLVKVSHHGSENGYCAELWEQHLSPQKRATAVVTAFSPKGLPRPEGVAHLLANSQRVVTTSLTSLKPKRMPQTLPSPFARMALDARIALSAIYKNASTVPNSAGSCSFTLDGGTTITEESSGDAGVLT
jgi:beta-lactamase superfamily II metal-dependent hydrolase